MTKYTNPQYTVEVLGKLVTLFGFTDDQFRGMHHRKDPVICIQAHLDYCHRTKAFKDGGTNELLAQRLEAVLFAHQVLQMFAIAA